MRPTMPTRGPSDLYPLDIIAPSACFLWDLFKVEQRRRLTGKATSSLSMASANTEAAAARWAFGLKLITEALAGVPRCASDSS